MNGKLTTKILLVLLSFVFVITALASCGADKEEFEALKTEVDAVEAQVNNNVSKLETLETKEVVAALQALAEQIKLTADAAATQTALSEAITKLETADTTKATVDALAETKAVLEASLVANATADQSTKVAIEAAIASVKSTADAAATAAALESAKTALEAADTANATAAATALADAKASLEAADTANATAAATALADAKATLEAALVANASADSATRTALESAIATLGDTVAANKAAAETALSEAVATLNTATSTVASNAAAALEAARSELNATIEANKQKAENDLAEAKTALTELLNANTAADETTKAQLESAIAGLEGVVADNAAAAADALTAAENTLNATIEANKQKAVNDLAEAKTALTELLNANTAADETTKAELESAIAGLEGVVADNAAAAADALTAAENTLNATIEANKQAAASELALAKSALEDALSENSTADAETKAALADAVETIAALTSTVNENASAAAAALEAAKNDITAAYTEAVGATKDELSDTVSVLDSAYKAADTALEESLAELRADYIAISGDVSALENIIGEYEPSDVATNVTEEITWIKGQLKVLGTEIQTEVAEFVSGYELATKVLRGEATVDDFAGFDNPDAAYAQYKDYTLANFKSMVKLISARAEWYNINADVKAEYDDFVDTLESVEFFLGRATRLAVVETEFTRFNEAVNALKTLPQLLDLQLVEIESNKLVTEDVKCYETAKAIVDKIDEINAENNPNTAITVDSALAARYDNVVNASANLATAKASVGTDVNDLIAVISGKSILVYGQFEDDVNTARTGFDTFKATYFANAVYNELYAKGADTVYDLVTDYATLTAAETRAEQLALAAVAVPTMLDCVENFDTVRPLYTDLEAIKTLDDALDAWKLNNPVWGNLETENITVIFGDGNDALVDKALAYANAMNTVHVNYEAATLKSNMETLNAKPLVLYADYSASLTYRAQLTALKSAIEGVSNYPKVAAEGSDGNLDAMIGNAVIESFEAVELQMTKLNTACVTIRGAQDDGVTGNTAGVGGFYGSMKLVNVDYYSSQKMKDLKTDVDKACSDAGITVGDANYALFVEEVVVYYENWMVEYNRLTEIIAEIYAEVDLAMKGEFGLSRGNVIITTNELADSLVLDLGVGNTDIDLLVAVDTNGDGTPDRYDAVNLKTVLTNWNNFVTAFKAKAEAAQEAATAVNAAIEAMLDTSGTGYLNPACLNNRAAILAVQELYDEWAAEYLLASEAVADIQAIQKSDLSGNYVFILEANFDGMMTAVAASDARVDAAKTYFDANVKPTFDAVAEDVWDIHSTDEFAAANSAYDTYVNEYYGGTITAESGEGYHGEYEAYEAMKAQEAAFDTLMGDVDTENTVIWLNNKINTAIAEVLDTTVDESNASEVAAKIDTIRADIGAFELEYKCDKYTCDSANDSYRISDADILALAKAEATADILVEISAAKTTAAGDTDKLASVATILETFYRQLASADTETTVSNVYAYASSSLANIVAGWTVAA